MLLIKKNTHEKLIEHALRDAPVEACGYLGEKDAVVESHYELKNVDKSAEHYSLDPTEQFKVVKLMRSKGEKLRAVYHSHPETPARPSEEDIRLAFDPDLSYVIVSLVNIKAVVKSFKISKSKVEEEEIRIEH